VFARPAGDALRAPDGPAPFCEGRWVRQPVWVWCGAARSPSAAPKAVGVGPAAAAARAHLLDRRALKHDDPPAAVARRQVVARLVEVERREEVG